MKFQRSHLNAKFTRSALDKPYNSPNSFGATYGDHKRFLEFSDEDFKELKRYSEENGMIFSASAMDEVSLGELLGMGVPFVKIGSGDSNNFSLLTKARDSGRPLIISTGMRNQETIERIYSLMDDNPFGLLHCVSAYPTAPEDANLQFIREYQNNFPKAIIGYSGHEVGQTISLAAIAMGAKILERHFTVDKTLKGSDHKCSLEPQEMAELVINVRKLERFLKGMKLYESSEIISALKTLGIVQMRNSSEIQGIQEDLEKAMNGENQRRLLQCEMDCFQKLGKSLVYSRNIDGNEVLTEKDFAIKISQPKGLEPEILDRIVGKTLYKSVQFEVPVEEQHFQP